MPKQGLIIWCSEVAPLIGNSRHCSVKHSCANVIRRCMHQYSRPQPFTPTHQGHRVPDADAHRVRCQLGRDTELSVYRDVCMSMYPPTPTRFVVNEPTYTITGQLDGYHDK